MRASKTYVNIINAWFLNYGLSSSALSNHANECACRVLLVLMMQPESTSGVGVAFCTFHHLLAGKEHQKEKDMVDTVKDLGLVGCILYGTYSYRFFALFQQTRDEMKYGKRFIRRRVIYMNE